MTPSRSVVGNARPQQRSFAPGNPQLQRTRAPQSPAGKGLVARPRRHILGGNKHRAKSSLREPHSVKSKRGNFLSVSVSLLPQAGGHMQIPMKTRPVLALAVLLLAAGCGDSARKQYAAVALALDQKWSKETADHFWWTSQGSQIVPYDWFLALEMPNSQELFSGNAHFERLRYITVSEKSAKNPGGLPIGYVKNREQVDGLDILGLSCSACHTAKWMIKGVAVQVEGGPAMGDTQTFLEELVASMTQTIDQPDKFDRFAKKVGADATALKTGLAKWRDRLEARLKRNPLPADNRPGFGRVDALGNIMNEVTAGDLGIAENARPTDAPVSYPHVWDAPQQNVVQWNGSIPNAGAGPALRNIGEVLGVFGTVAIAPQKGKLPKYPTSTIETKNLNAIEQDLWALSSPLWPENLVPIDKALAAAGKPFYEQRCAVLPLANRPDLTRAADCGADEKCGHRRYAEPERPADGEDGRLEGNAEDAESLRRIRRGGLRHRGAHERDLRGLSPPRERFQGRRTDRHQHREENRTATAAGRPAGDASSRHQESRGGLPGNGGVGGASLQAFRKPADFLLEQVQGPSAQRHLGHRTFPAQRFGADAGGDAD